MISTLAYGLTIGGIFYIISIGLSLTFGTMRIVNFAHALVYTVGAYVLMAALRARVGFLLAAVIGVAATNPLAWCIERFVIRRLYGQSIDYAIIATYAVLLIGVDATKWIFGATPVPLSDPIGSHVVLAGVSLPVYRLVIIAMALVIFAGLEVFFRSRTRRRRAPSGCRSTATSRWCSSSAAASPRSAGSCTRPSPRCIRTWASTCCSSASRSCSSAAWAACAAPSSPPSPSAW